jgi:two-component system NtrC family sensor kinase
MPTKSLSKIAIRAMSIRLSIVVLVASFLSYNHNYQTIKTKTILELQKYVKERVERESIRFELAAQNLDLLDKTFTERLEQPISNLDQIFAQKFAKRKDGTYRHRHADHPFKNQALIRPNTLTPVIKKNMVIADELLTSFGTAWSSTFLNVWIVGKEDYGALLWPSRPHALGQIPNDYSFLPEEYMTVGVPANNPFGKPVWTGPYFDVVSDGWVVSINHPYYYKGDFLFSFGMDISLADLDHRTVTNALEGTYNLVFQDDGRLIIHPKMINDIITTKGKYYLQQSPNSLLKNIYQEVIRRPGEVVFNEEHKVFLASGRIKGPEWLFVIVYPETNLSGLAMETAQFVAIIGIISLFIELLMLFQVLQRFVTTPITQLIDASNRIADGSNYAKVEIETDDEVGHLAKSFNTMSEKVMERDSKLVAQAEALESLVQERTQELDLQRAKAFQSAKMATLGEMSGGIAHEINNPLTIIGMSAESIKKHVNLPSVDKLKILTNVERIEKTVGRISKIVKGMRAFSRNAESDPQVLTSVNQIIENTLNLCEETLKMKNVTLRWSPNDDYSVYCREVEITQALLNLIQNAIDAVKDMEKREIHIYTEIKQGVVKIAVEDSGEGIPLDLQAKIMNPFFTTKEIGKGTGLGLFISLGLVESNGGKLYLDRESKQTKFVIELALAAHFP